MRSAPVLRAGIREKIIALSVLSVLLPILIPNALLYLKANRIMEDEYRQHAVAVLQQAVNRVDDLVGDLDRLSRAPYLNHEVLRVFAAPFGSTDIRSLLSDRRVVENFISGLYQLSSNVFAIYIFTPSGEHFSTDLSMFPINRRFDPKAQPWYPLVGAPAVRGGALILPPRVPEHTLNPTMVISHVTAIRSLEDESKVIALMIIDVRFDRFASLLRGATDSKSDRLYVLDGDGTVLFSRTPADLGTDGSRLLRSIRGKGSGVIPTLLVSPRTGWRFLSVVARGRLRGSTGVLLRYSIVASTITAMVIVTAAAMLASGLTRPLRRLAAVMGQVEGGSLDVRFDHESSDEIGSLSRGFNAMMATVRELMTTVTSYRLATREAEIQLLLSKINPHFLYNTLQSIQMQAAIEGSGTITRMIELLGRYLRYNLDAAVDVARLETEMAHMEDYIDLQNLRFGGRLACTIEVPEVCLGLGVPRLVIQPILENAIRHGLEEQVGECRLLVSARREGGSLAIVVSDNGRGMSPQRLAAVRRMTVMTNASGRSGGLANVCRRLALLFPDRASVSIDSEPGRGTQVVVSLPVLDEAGITSLNGIHERLS